MFKKSKEKNTDLNPKSKKSNKALNKVKKAFILLFLILIIIPPILTNHKKDEHSKLDNKALFEISSFKEIFENPIILEDYLSDRIGFRDNLIALNTNVLTQSINILNHPLYDYGKNDEVFYKFSKPDDLSDYIDEFSNFVEKLQNYVEGEGKEFLFVITPSKNSVYPEYIPDTIVYNNENMDRLKKRLKEKKINTLNLTNYLINAKPEGRMFYKKYNVGHWSDRGSIVGIENIIAQLRKTNSNVQPFNSQNFDTSYKLKKYLPTSKILINENIETFIPKTVYSERDKVKLDGVHKELLLDENYNTYINYYNPKAKDAANALFFTGSYINNRYAYFSDSFSEINGIHNYNNVINADYYMNLFDSDIVLFEVAETAINPEYFNYEKLKEKTFPDNYKNKLDYEKIKLKDRNQNFINLNIDTQNYLSNVEINIDKSKLPDFDNIYIETKAKKIYTVDYDENQDNILSINTSMWNEDMEENKLILSNSNTKINYWINFSTLKK